MKREVGYFKDEKQEQKNMLHLQRQQEYLKNTSLKQMIKNQQQEANDRKRRELNEKQMKARAQLEEKMSKEEMARMEHEQMVAKMEQEELELIQRLQNT